MSITFFFIGFVFLLSFVYVGLVVKEFIKVMHKRVEMLHVLGAEDSITRSNKALISWFYVATSILWSGLLFGYFIWLAQQLS